MANIRTLKLNLLADTDNFGKGLKKATGQSESFAKKVGKNFAIAGAAIGGVALAIGVDSVKAALQDEKGQRRLAIALKNTTGATKKQIAAQEAFIAKTQASKGVVDDKLRPAFQRLVSATKDTKKAQDLLNLALDISAATGKDVETVSAALSKGYAGNNASLGRLGLGVSAATLKSKDFTKVQKELADITKGQATAAAETLQGRMDRLGIAVDEAKESMGNAILKAFTPLAEKWLPKISEGVTNFVAGLTGEDGVTGAAKKGEDAIYNLGKKAKDFFKFLADHKEALAKTAAIMAGIFIGAKAGTAAQAMITAIKSIVTIMRTLTSASALAAGAEAAATGGGTFYAALPAILAIGGAFGVAALMGLGDTPGAGKNKKTRTELNTYVEDQLSKTYFPGFDSTTTTTTPSKFKQSHTTINLNGIVDAESARRSIVSILQDSSLRTGTVVLNRVAI